MIEVIAESTWSWLLYANGEQRILAVVCGSVGIYEWVIELNDAERAAITADAANVEKLAQRIQASPTTFQHRHQADLLDNAAATAATQRWRSRSCD